MSRPKKVQPPPTIEAQLQALIAQATAEGRYRLARDIISILEEEKKEKKEGVVVS